VLSSIGKAADRCWKKIPSHHEGVELDDYVIMPNHIHGIIIIGEPRRDVQLNVPTEDTLRAKSKNKVMVSLSPKKGSLSVIVRTFKAAVTTWARENEHEDFGWQERFHDHIIRNDEDLRRIRAYIANNPLQWAIDEENPARSNEPR
jgi:REP element-mobilizing transposase RayT